MTAPATTAPAVDRGRPVPKPAAVSEAPIPPPFDLPSGGLGARLEALLLWLRTTVDCQRVFVADGDGLILVAKGMSAEGVAVATTAWSDWRDRQRLLGLPPLECVTVVSEDLRSNLLSESSPWGEFTLGFSMAHPPASAIVARIRGAFRCCLEENGPMRGRT